MCKKTSDLVDDGFPYKRAKKIKIARCHKFCRQNPNSCCNDLVRYNSQLWDTVTMKCLLLCILENPSRGCISSQVIIFLGIIFLGQHFLFFCQKYCGPYCIGRGMISSSNCNKAQPGTAHILPSCLYIFAGGKQSRLGLANSAFDPHQQKSWRTFPDKSKQGFSVGNCNCAEG